MFETDQVSARSTGFMRSQTMAALICSTMLRKMFTDIDIAYEMRV